ncbi:MAG: hypothetical protein K2O24_06030 [Muribaculaceae bacterium]|nr:hypothetical protein [Muribaculaceae bacterium]
MAAVLVMVGSIAGCSDEILVEPQAPEVARPGYINLTIAVAEGMETRATEPGVDPYNENLITSVTVCMWPVGGDWNEKRTPLVKETFTGLNAVGQTVVRIPLTEFLMSHLFNQDSSNTCNVFAVANVDTVGCRTVADFRNKVIDSKFRTEQMQPCFAMEGTSTAQLTGNTAVGMVEMQRTAAKIDLHVTGKDEVEEKLDGNVVKWKARYDWMTVRMVHGVDTTTLVPDVRNGVAEKDYFTTDPQLEYGFELRTDDGTGGNHPGPTGAKGEYVQTIPFYTYPNSWTESLTDMNRTRLLLALPWTTDDGHTIRVCYYQVPVVSLDKTEIVRNVSYHVHLDVSVLGSLVPEEPMTLEDVSYTAAPWGTKELDVELTDVRYLVFDQTQYTVNNADQFDISFYTSHPVEVVDCYMVFYRFNYSDEGNEFPVTVSREQNTASWKDGDGVYSISFLNTEGSQQVLRYWHPLMAYQPYISKTKPFDLTNGDKPDGGRNGRPVVVKLSEILEKMKSIKFFKKTNDAEFSKVEFFVTVQHKDKHAAGENTFKESLVITQYPGMYITSPPNTSERYITQTVNGVTNIVAGDKMANVYINGNIGDNDLGWNDVIGLNSGKYYNWNPNMYLITITRLDNNNYIINDPRRIQINNNLSNSSMSAANNRTEYKTPWATFIEAIYVDGGNKKRKLSYYHPTNETDEAENMIAPKFRICSSMAGTGAVLTRVQARRRAAAFQEMGYPAGRWRLPTWGEVRFITELSDNGKIPRLFGVYNNDTWHYWCAQGAVKVPGKPYQRQSELVKDYDVSSKERARFVYDEWYWGEGTLKSNGQKPNDSSAIYQFTWGDSDEPLSVTK